MPDVHEMLHDPRALAEGRATAQQLKPGHLAKLRTAQKNESEKADGRWRANASRWWDLWQNDVKYADKEEWQSQIWVPKPFVAVEQANALISRSLLESPAFFGIDGQDDNDKLLAAHVWRPLLTWALGQAKFVPKFSDACKVGFIMGLAGYLKFRWAYAQVPVLAGASVDPATGSIMPAFRQKTASMLAIDYVLPFNVFRDPDTTPRENFSGSYLYHSEWKDRAVLAKMAKAGWNPEAVRKILAGGSAPSSGMGSGTESQQREMERRQQAYERHEFRKPALIDEGWLDILDENGEVVFPNALMVLSGEEVLLPPTDNPLWATDLRTGRRKWPFVACAPIAHPTRFIGRGILEQDEDLSMMFSQTLNLTADGMNWEVNREAEVFQGGLVDWDDTARYPGKTWITTVKEQVVKLAQSGGVDVSKVMAFLNYLDMQREEANFVNNYVSGLPGHRADTTKGEVQIRTSQSMGVFDGMGRNLEEGGATCVELAQNFLMQYLGGNDYTDPSIASILGPHLSTLIGQMPLAERVQHLQGQYDYTFTGVTQALQKAELLKNLMQAATLANSPGFAGRTNNTQILRVIFEAMGVMDKIDVFDPPPAMLPGMVAPGMAPGAGGDPRMAGNPRAHAQMRAIASGAPPDPMEGM